MKIQIKDKIEIIRCLPRMVDNRTLKYLFPIMKAYGEEAVTKINSIYKIGVGVGDTMFLNKNRFLYNKHLFLLVSPSIEEGVFLDFLEWAREQPFYEEDYVYGALSGPVYHMFVFKVPEEYYDSVSRFMESKYSKMFKSKTLESHFKAYPEAFRVLSKDEKYKISFINRVNRDYGTEIDNFDIPDYELDYPIEISNEYFGAELGRS